MLEEQAEGGPGRSRSRWPDRGRWPRPSRSRAATRCSATTAPGASWRRRWPRACAGTCATCAAGCRAPSGWSSRSTSPRSPPCSAGKVPTASGWGRHRTVHPPEASETLGWVLDAITRGGRRAVGAHLRVRTPLGLLRGAGARGLVVDLVPAGRRRPRRARARRSRRGSTSCSGVLPSRTRPGADREAGHRVRGALAGHARARPGHGRRARWASRPPAGSRARRTTGPVAPWPWPAPSPPT